MYFGGDCLPCCGGCSDDRAYQTWLDLIASPLQCTISGTIPASDAAVGGRAFATSFAKTNGGFVSGSRNESTAEAFLNSTSGTSSIYYVASKPQNNFGTYDLAVDLTPRPVGITMESDYTQWKPPFEWTSSQPAFGYARFVHAASLFTLIVTLRVDAIAATGGMTFAGSACRVTGSAYVVTQRQHAIESVPFASRFSTSVQSFGTLRVATGSWDALERVGGSDSRVFLYCNDRRYGTYTYYNGWAQSPGKPSGLAWQPAIEARAGGSLAVASANVLSGTSPIVYGLAPYRWLPFASAGNSTAWASSISFNPTTYTGGGGFPDSIEANWCGGGVTPAATSFVRPPGAEYAFPAQLPPAPRGVPTGSNIEPPLLTGGTPPGVLLGFSVTPA